MVTGGVIFSSKCTKKRLAAGLRPGPLGELERSPNPLAAIRGVLLLKGGGIGKGGEVDAGRERGRREGKERGERNEVGGREGERRK